MDFKDQILQIADRVARQKESVKTEEATKMAFIAPFISALGYDIFNPSEVIPEMDCDLTKKGDRIDYAIQKNGETIILVECKHCTCSLDIHSTQLAKYYAASNAKFAILTNGIEYRFYTDIDKNNIMDEKPFMVINIMDLSDNDIEQLKKFHKSYFCEKQLSDNAKAQKYTREIKQSVLQELTSPSTEFVSMFARRINSWRITQPVIDMVRPIVIKSINEIINEIINERLDNAMKIMENKEEPVEPLPNGIITTEEEIEGYNIVRSILCEHVDASRIQYKDCKSYFIINLDGRWNWICRLYLGARTKQICFPIDGYSSNEWVEIQSIESIFSLKDKLYNSLQIALRNAHENISERSAD